jgi:two-component system cell cycle sensor histidine kinase/response regulator CckA
MTISDNKIHSEQDSDVFLGEQTRLLLQNSRTAVAVNLAIAFLTYLAIPSSHYLWLWLIVGASVLRLAYSLWCTQQPESVLLNPIVYFGLLSLITLQGISWGIASVLLYTTASDLHKFYLIAIVCGMSGGSILTLAPSFIAFTCFTLPTVTPLVLSLLFDSEKTFTHAGFMGLVFLIAVHFLARRINRFNIEFLQANKRLAVTAEELSQHKNRLERTVEDRTIELKASSDNYRRLTEEINEAIFELDADAAVKYISPVITKILGLLPERLVGTPFKELVYRDDQQLLEGLLAHEITEGTEGLKPIDCRFYDRAGDPRWVRVSIRQILVGERIGGYRGVLGDIEKEKKTEVEKAELLQRFYENQKLESIATLAGGVAHKFNNLLMGIQGHASLLAAKSDPAGPHLDHVRVIEAQVHKAKELTTQLLGAARGGKYDPKPVDLNELLAGSISMFERDKQGITIDTNISKESVIIEADRQQIDQVMSILLVNASEAMPGGGQVQLESVLLELDSQYCQPYGVVPGRYVKISVNDEGYGMDKAILPRIFDPFFTTKEKGHGTGLGLASAYGIIKNHGGFISVKSQPGQGSTFYLYLPVSEKQIVEKTRIEPKVIKGSGTILIVDDEELVLSTGQALLKRLGYTVIAAESGEQAISFLKQKGEEIDLVILDMIMPGMDGGVTFDKLRKICPSIPVILSSGYSLEGQATEIMKKGCNGFLQKPFGMAELSQKIKESLNT